MKKILSFFIHNRKAIIKGVAIVGIAFASYVLAHKIGTIERGYEAIGGEIFFPLLVVFSGKILAMIKEPFKAVREK